MPTSRPPAGGKSVPARTPRTSSALLNVQAPSYLSSAAVHFVAILVMACLVVDLPRQATSALLTATTVDPAEEFVPEVDTSIPLKLDVTSISATSADTFQQIVSAQPIDLPTDTPANDPDEAAAMEIAIEDFGQRTAPSGVLSQVIGRMGTGLEGRSAKNRGATAISQGASEPSERAVAAALQWLAEHQLPDGGWNFDHRGGACNGRCANAGDLKECRTGATAMALLPMLGAGQTHKEGKYRKNVEAGLYFLVNQMKVTGNRGDLAQGGGNLYAHGLAAIVLTEAYAMTHDKGLITPAQYALNHIVFAQDPVGGGWRYQPKQPGDTSVVGWQLMALKSGNMAYLHVPKDTVLGAGKFLDSVQTDSGAKYGYADPGAGAGTTAVGLLCRMYMGWKKEHPGIERGVEFLGRTGPSKTNLYYDYYATQVMRHYGGEPWQKWNAVMRDQLVDTQDKQGHQAGSWFVAGDTHSTGHGGRLYCTSLATMILEVYYRHQPLYAGQAAEDFALE